MDPLVAILLGVLQGLTEFFPVSSSGHLALFGHWFGLAEPDLTFDVLVHLATLLAILVYFRADWIQLFRLLFRRGRGDLPRLLIPYLLLSMIPAGLVGFLLEDQVEWFHARPGWVGVFLIVNGLLLLWGMRHQGGGKSFEDLSFGTVIGIALAQATAILPGISRSGSTIVTGQLLGLDRRAAARFSFLMVVPVIGGAGLLKLLDLFANKDALSTDLLFAYGAGFVAATLSGFFALAFLMRLLEGPRFFQFGFYCLALGLFALAL